MRSFCTIDAGTVQYGLKLTWMILLLIFRRRPIRFAGHGGVARHRDAVFDRLDARGRNVADHIAGRQIRAERTQSRDIDLELREPHRRRHVECGQRLGPNDAVDGQSVARLKAPHRGLDVGIVDVIAHCVRVDIAGSDQTRAQCGHAGMPIAEAEHFDAGHLGPAAARDDRGIAFDRLLRGLRRRRRDGRLRLLGHADGAGRIVETLPEPAALGVAHQRVECGILGESARGQSGRRDGGNAGGAL